MFGRLGTGELILILAIALIVVGPSKLPELGKAVGKTFNEFKKFSKDIKEDLSLEDKPVKVANHETTEIKKNKDEVNEVNEVKEDKDNQ